MSSGEHARREPDDQGPSPRARRVRLMVILVVAVVIVGGCAALIYLPKRAAVNQLDPAINARTGLADGKYVMVAKNAFHQDGECWYQGVPQSPQLSVDEAPEVTVYGRGPVACAGPSLGQVVFIVTDSVAEIEKSGT